MLIFIYSDQNVFMAYAVTPLQYTVQITEERFSLLYSPYEFFSSYHLTCYFWQHLCFLRSAHKEHIATLTPLKRPPFPIG